MNKGHGFRSRRVTSGLVGFELTKLVNGDERVTKEHIKTALRGIGIISATTIRNYTDSLRANGIIDERGILNRGLFKPTLIMVTTFEMYKDEVKERVDDSIVGMDDVVKVKEA